MRTKNISILARWIVPALLIAATALAQTKPFAPDKMDTILYGVAYYPEYMPYERLDKDVEMMKKAGITVVRVGESTWSTWEPSEGQYRFDWMQRVLDRMHEAGIRVILGTPTYSIPTWLYHKDPSILVTHYGPIPPLKNPYFPTFPPSLRPGEYGPRQNIDLLNPVFREASEKIIRQIIGHFAKHPAVIGYQIDNETGSTGAATKYTQAEFIRRLQQKYKSLDTINKMWGLVYWGQLIDNWDDFPPRDGILNPGYKLEWERFQHDIVTEFLGWQTKIVNEYKRPDQFIMQDFSGGVHTNLDQWAIARHLDIVGENPYFETQDQLDGRMIWITGDLARSLKHTNYLITETNAQTIGWDSRAQYPPYPGQTRLVVYTHLAAGANMVEYWHWSSLHYGQETYWRGVLSHDLEPNRVYNEVAATAAELKRVGPQIVNMKHSTNVAILLSVDSANALSYMPVSDKVNYMSVLEQMYKALYALNIEPDFVQAGDTDFSKYKVLLVPPLYSASDAILQGISDYVKNGGHVVMAFKSGFTDEFSTVRHDMAPGPLRAAAGFRYQEFSNFAERVPLVPDAFHTADKNWGSVWSEFLIPETAKVIESYDHPYWKFPAITRNDYGSGTLTYEGTVVSDDLQRDIVRDVITRAKLTGPDQSLPAVVRVRHGINSFGKTCHYYLNFSGKPQSFTYAYGSGSDLLTSRSVTHNGQFTLKAWDVAIIAESR